MANVNEICDETGNVCEAFLTTSGNTCTQACADAGLMCEAGWDDLDTCTPKNDGSRTGNGCDQGLNTQICRCVTGDPPLYPMLLHGAHCCWGRSPLSATPQPAGMQGLQE